MYLKTMVLEGVQVFKHDKCRPICIKMFFFLKHKINKTLNYTDV